MIPRILILTIAAGSPFTFAQDPFSAAGSHYHLALDNQWIRIARVAYAPHEKSALHEHPAVPCVYVYTTDGGPIRFSHHDAAEVVRKPVKAGQVRFARPNLETHEVEYLGDEPTEYLRIELKTQPLDLPKNDVRLPAEPHSGAKSLIKTEFENGQVRLVRVYCAPDKPCQATEHPGTPAVMINLQDRTFEWVGPEAAENAPKAGDHFRIEMKSKPISN